MSAARRPQGKKATTKAKRWRWVVGTIGAIVVLLVISLALHKSGHAPRSAFGPQAASSSAPESSQPATPTTSPSTSAQPGDGAIDDESPLPNLALRRIQQVVAGFVDAYYTRRYTDPPNANVKLVQRFITPGFVGPLPQTPARTSDAGQSFYEYRTVSIASASGIAYDLATKNRVIVTVAITQTTSYEGSGTNWYTFTRILTLTQTRGSWLVAELAEGVYGP